MTHRNEESSPPILDKGGRNVARPVKSRIKGVAQKCKCGSVWCPQCFRQKHAAAHMARLRKFNYKHIRGAVLTVDPAQFEDGEAALEYLRAHRAIQNLIRNIERGAKVQNEKGEWIVLYEPLPIKDWIWFIEWHEGGYPHFHLFIETKAKGKAGMIGGDRIRHYWKAGTWVHETYIKSEKHFRKLTGYFRGHGYFEVKGKHAKLKRHQVTLPTWAQEKYGSGSKIRRVGAKCLGKMEKSSEEYFDRIVNTTEVIDIQTGEVLRTPNKKERSKRTYKAILKSCGQKTRIKIISGNSHIIAVVNKPYKKVKNKIPGQYEKGQGYVFDIEQKTIDWLFDNVLHIEVLFLSNNDRDFLKKNMDKWHDIRIERGYWEYRKYHG